jgi:arabinogalactan endo-1,4-beta-galactosidase
MKSLKTILAILCILPFVTSKGQEKPDRNSSGFIVGADLSLLDKINDYGGVYKEKGVEKDALEIFQNNGYNYVRLRLFHTPNMEGSTCQDLPYTLKLAKRVKKAGMKLLLDFHYSDTWADPGKQFKPKAWEGLPFSVLVDSVYKYTFRVMNAFAAEGITPDMVQPGNEIPHGMIWPDGKLDGNTEAEKSKQWTRFTDLLKAGIRGIKDSPGGNEIPVMIHIANGGDQDRTQWFFNNLLQHQVGFDIIGQSYYPWWHGTFEMLEENIRVMTQAYKKDIIIVETAYFRKGEYQKGAKYSGNQPYPCTDEGQYNFLQQLYQICRKYPSVKGLFYWYPESVKTTIEANLPYRSRSLFDEDGEALPGISAFQKE